MASVENVFCVPYRLVMLWPSFRSCCDLYSDPNIFASLKWPAQVDSFPYILPWHITLGYLKMLLLSLYLKHLLTSLKSPVTFSSHLHLLSHFSFIPFSNLPFDFTVLLSILTFLCPLTFITDSSPMSLSPYFLLQTICCSSASISLSFLNNYSIKYSLVSGTKKLNNLLNHTMMSTLPSPMPSAIILSTPSCFSLFLF